MTIFRFIILLFTLLVGLRLFAQDVTINNIPDYGDRLKMGFVNKGNVSFNPLINNTDYDQEINKLIFGMGLYSTANDGHIIHGIADSTKVIDPLLLRFEIRPDIHFHDGTSVTVEDVKFSYELYKKFAFQSPQLFNARHIDVVEIYVTNIIRIKLESPIPNFSETIGQLPILSSRHYREWMKFDSVSQLPKIEPIGFGYYVPSANFTGDSLKLDVDLNHSMGRSYLDGIDIFFYKTYDQLLDAFLHEKIDIIKIDDKSVWQKVSQFTENIINTNNKEQQLYYINYNTKRFPFSDIRIRKALNYSINKQQITNSLLNNNAIATHNLLMNENDRLSDSFHIYKYFPLEGLQILLNNKFKKNRDGKLSKNGRELKFELLFEKGSPLGESIARLIAINLGEIGINVIPRSLSAFELNNTVLKGNYQAVISQFSFEEKNKLDTIHKFYLFELNKFNNFQNFTPITLKSLINSIEDNSDDVESSKILHQFQYILNQNSPCLFLFTEYKNKYALNSRFKNVFTSYFQTTETKIIKLNPKNEWYVPKDKQKY